MICQSPKESPQKFLFRALDLRNKVLFVSQEDDSKFDYGFPLIQNTFLKSLETGLHDDIFVTNLRPILRTPDISDEDLMKHVNELASNQVERQSKLEQKSAKVNSTNVNEGQRASKPKENPKPHDELLAEIHEIKSDLAMLKQQNNSNFVAPSSWPRGRSPSRGRGHGRSVVVAGDLLLECIGYAQIVSLLDSPILANTVLRVGHMTTTRVTVPAFNHRETGTSYTRGTGCNRWQ